MRYTLYLRLLVQQSLSPYPTATAGSSLIWTPVFFLMHSSTMIDTVGNKSINIRTTKNASQHTTVAVCITAGGNQLPLLIIFKGKQSNKGGRILGKELKTSPKEAFYETQENTWMSKGMMLLWVEKVVKPYVVTAPPGIIPLLFLNSYKVHLMASVHNAINDLGVEIIIVPPGCTGLTQPNDVGFNKPFKNRMRDQYEA